MKEKIINSAKSTNFWNNISNIVSGIVLVVLALAVKDPETLKNIILIYAGSTAPHNAGNIMAHINKGA